MKIEFRGSGLGRIVGELFRFISGIGFIQPVGTPGTDGVFIRVTFNRRIIYEGIKTYTGRLATIDADMSAFDGQTGTLVIEVFANGTSGQDWLCWIRPRIAFR